MTTLTYSELFAGAGGLSLGLDAAGFHAAAHAEIEPHARAVLRYRWPETRLDGDVTKIDGADYTGITLLSGGSPCQDLSVAGKRAGLTGSRSSLFHEQCRIWRESDAPYLLWENVLGALSSNDGADFATVLSTIVGSTVHVPRDGWRGGGGVVAGRDAVAAWRVLDLQHFGPPQRRVRVFILAARAGGVDPAEVLALNEGVCRHPSPRQQSREGFAARARGGAQGGVMVFKAGQSEAAVGFHHKQDPISGHVSPAIGRETDGMGVLCISETGQGFWTAGEPLAGPRADPGGMPAHVICTTGDITHALTHEGADASEDGTGRWTPIVARMVAYGEYTEDGMAGAIKARDYKDATDLVYATQGRPRRLTPLECERLMSWPDTWTATGRKDDGTEYALSDTARYRLCGNGVGSVCAEWIGRRLMAAITAQVAA